MIRSFGIVPSMKIHADALQQVRQALSQYTREVEATDMTDSTKKTYLLHAENFVRWLAGEFVPGTRARKERQPNG